MADRSTIYEVSDAITAHLISAHGHADLAFLAGPAGGERAVRELIASGRGGA